MTSAGRSAHTSWPPKVTCSARYNSGGGEHPSAPAGIMSWEGTAGGRETYRWSHVCVSVAYTGAGADRRVAVDGVMSNVTVTSDYFRSASCRHTVYNVTLPQDGGVAARAQPDAGGAGAVLLRGAPPRPPHRRAGVLQGAHGPGDGGIHRVPGGGGHSLSKH